MDGASAVIVHERVVGGASIESIWRIGQLFTFA